MQENCFDRFLGSWAGALLPTLAMLIGLSIIGCGQVPFKVRDQLKYIGKVQLDRERDGKEMLPGVMASDIPDGMEHLGVHNASGVSIDVEYYTGPRGIYPNDNRIIALAVWYDDKELTKPRAAAYMLPDSIVMLDESKALEIKQAINRVRLLYSQYQEHQRLLRQHPSMPEARRQFDARPIPRSSYSRGWWQLNDSLLLRYAGNDEDNKLYFGDLCRVHLGEERPIFVAASDAQERGDTLFFEDPYMMGILVLVLKSEMTQDWRKSIQHWYPLAKGDTNVSFGSITQLAAAVFGTANHPAVTDRIVQDILERSGRNINGRNYVWRGTTEGWVELFPPDLWLNSRVRSFFMNEKDVRDAVREYLYLSDKKEVM